MNKLLWNSIATSLLMLSRRSNNRSGSAAQTVTLLSALEKLKEQGYRIIIADTDGPFRRRVHFDIWSPNLDNKLGGITIVEGVEKRYIQNKMEAIDTDNIYRVEGAGVDPSLRGLGKALYFAVLVWAEQQDAWVGADRNYSVRPEAQRVYKFWSKDPNIESITLPQLGYLQTQLDRDLWRSNFLSHNKPIGYLNSVEFMDRRLAQLGIRSHNELDAIEKKKIWSEYVDFRKSWIDKNKQKLKKTFEQSPIRSLYKLKPGTYIKERKLLNSFTEYLSAEEWYALMEAPDEELSALSEKILSQIKLPKMPKRK